MRKFFKIGIKTFILRAKILVNFSTRASRSMSLKVVVVVVVDVLVLVVTYSK